MSCHNPFDSDDGCDGHAVWVDLLQVVSHENNQYVRFAVLGGDQVYSDEFKAELLAERDDAARLGIYLKAYRKFWSNIHYRRVMAGLPAVMIWDDHEIIDGWGSEVASFVPGTSRFKDEWAALFRSASSAFAVMQASRNPPLLSNDAFDCCFRVGKVGFALLDLRTNRNLIGKPHHERCAVRPVQGLDGCEQAAHAHLVRRQPGRVLARSAGRGAARDEALEIRADLLRVCWRASPRGKGIYARFDQSVGDIRDDIRDAWSAENNADRADEFLDALFGLQNDPAHPVAIVILSGDIHTSGFATIYSSDNRHAERSSMPHITSSSVSYKPFNWILEAIYRHAAKVVPLGKKRAYTSLVSHHFSARSVCVLSVRPIAADDNQLKVKYYVEGYPEPQILLFDLARISRRENISWVAADKFIPQEFVRPTEVDIEKFLETHDIDAMLQQRAAQAGQKLNYKESIVDLLKLLGQDSTLGARKRLAQQLGLSGRAERLGRDEHLAASNASSRNTSRASGSLDKTLPVPPAS